jgi:hypothetical protein
MMLLALRAEVRDLVKWVPREMILDMDKRPDPVSLRSSCGKPAAAT